MKTSIDKQPDGSSVLTIVVPLESSPKASSTGKSFLLANTSGFCKTGLTHAGQPVSLSLNVIIPAR